MTSVQQSAAGPQIPYSVSHHPLLNFSSNTDYVHIFDFEKLDYITLHQVAMKWMPLYHIIGLLYLISVYSLKKWMEGREGFQLRRGFLFLWNVSLSALSAILFWRVLPELVYVITNYGLYESYCRQNHVSMATAFWGAVYACSKVLEFGNAWLILLRKQPLTFLQTFHYLSIYLTTVWSYLLVDPVFRIGLVMNCSVQIIMYAYLALKAALQVKLPRGLSIAVTSVQVVQGISLTVINWLSVYAYVLGTQPACQRPREILTLILLIFIVYAYLFANSLLNSCLRMMEKQVSWRGKFVVRCSGVFSSESLTDLCQMTR